MLKQSIFICLHLLQGSDLFTQKFLFLNEVLLHLIKENILGLLSLSQEFIQSMIKIGDTSWLAKL